MVALTLVWLMIMLIVNAFADVGRGEQDFMLISAACSSGRTDLCRVVGDDTVEISHHLLRDNPEDLPDEMDLREVRENWYQTTYFNRGLYPPTLETGLGIVGRIGTSASFFIPVVRLTIGLVELLAMAALLLAASRCLSPATTAILCAVVGWSYVSLSLGSVHPSSVATICLGVAAGLLSMTRVSGSQLSVAQSQILVVAALSLLVLATAARYEVAPAVILLLLPLLLSRNQSRSRLSVFLAGMVLLMTLWSVVGSELGILGLKRPPVSLSSLLRSSVPAVEGFVKSISSDRGQAPSEAHLDAGAESSGETVHDPIEMAQGFIELAREQGSYPLGMRRGVAVLNALALSYQCLRLRVSSLDRTSRLLAVGLLLPVALLLTQNVAEFGESVHRYALPFVLAVVMLVTVGSESRPLFARLDFRFSVASFIMLTLDAVGYLATAN